MYPFAPERQLPGGTEARGTFCSPVLSKPNPLCQAPPGISCAGRLESDPWHGAWSPWQPRIYYRGLHPAWRTFDSRQGGREPRRQSWEQGAQGAAGDPKMAKFLSQDQINEYKECFSLYDKQQRGKIKATDLIVVMRCLGASPTPGEVQRHLQTHRIDRNGELDFSTFLTIMHMQIKQEDPKKEILLAMLMADKEKKGYIMASELRSKLMRLGEKLTHKEVDDLFRETNIEPNGKVKYDEFIHKITIPVVEY